MASQARPRMPASSTVSSTVSGTPKSASRLPTHRELAAKHGLALGTASRVYAELVAIGRAMGRAGIGNFDPSVDIGLGAAAGNADDHRLPPRLDPMHQIGEATQPGDARLLNDVLYPVSRCE